MRPECATCPLLHGRLHDDARAPNVDHFPVDGRNRDPSRKIFVDCFTDLQKFWNLLYSIARNLRNVYTLEILTFVRKWGSTKAKTSAWTTSRSLTVPPTTHYFLYTHFVQNLSSWRYLLPAFLCIGSLRAMRSRMRWMWCVFLMGQKWSTLRQQMRGLWCLIWLWYMHSRVWGVTYRLR